MKRSHAGLVVLSVATVVMVTLAAMKESALSVPAAAVGPVLPSVTAPPASRPVVPVAFIGDSYTAGSGMGGNADANWTSRVQAMMPALGIQIPVSRGTAGGSGYVHRGPTGKVFPDLVASPTVDASTRLVVVFGSRNDAGEPGVDAAATATYTAIKHAAPNAELLVIGPPWVNEKVPTNITAVRDSVKTEAIAAGATFVDPLAEHWFFGADAGLIGSDGIHPTDEGHRYMASKIAPHLHDALAELVAE